jgi:endonuclease YncB( thermonuclease family)
MAQNKIQPALLVILTLSALIVAWSIKGEEHKPADHLNQGVANKANATELTEIKLTSKEFDILKNCNLVKHRNNDGDSFLVRHGKKETEFRLYFVDAAESKFKNYENGEDNGDRIREQGAYFGGLEMQVTIEMGRAAKSFVLDLLSKQQFTVVTKWEDVFTPERKYCYVIVKWDGKEFYLHELLIAKGLVRIKTRGAALPDQTTFYLHKQKLLKMEQQAKTARLGAWGM